MVKKLGFGLMRLPLLDKNDSGSVDIEQLKQMVDRFIEKGFTYFDTAWMYCAFQSERAIKEALVKRYPRSAYTLTTKLHVSYVKCDEDKDRIFNEQREKTGVDYFDYYLLHALSKDNYPKYQQYHCFEWLLDKKQKGEVKHIGFSFHDDAKTLDHILSEHPEVEFVQLQINYLDWDSESVQSRLCHEVALKHHKKVIIMEPVKGGTLVNVPSMVKDMMKKYDENASIASWAIRYAASLENVFMVLSGMSNVEQLEDNTNYMQDFKPLCDEEYKIIEKTVEILNSKVLIPCTGCNYCVEGCPKHIPISKCFLLYNMQMQNEDVHDTYFEQADHFGLASACVACGQCEKVCPQHLPIINNLKKVKEIFE